MPAEHRSSAWRWWDDYGAGIVRPDDPRLVTVPSVQGRACVLHWAAAAVFRALAADWIAEYPRSRGLLLASGWRPHRWASREQYEATLIQRYGTVARGRIYLAYRSPHETGMALDFGSPPPLEPRSVNAERMRSSAAYDWLMAHAPERGLRCYLPEPWHWELPLPREVWAAAGPER